MKTENLLLFPSLLTIIITLIFIERYFLLRVLSSVLRTV